MRHSLLEDQPRPYLLEGLDCSGKKTVARRVLAILKERELDTRLVIGPLVEGQLGRLDGKLANITSHVSPTSLLGRSRRLFYVVGPVIDGVCYWPRSTDRVLKVSSHYRAWARAQAEDDRLMDRAYAVTSALHPRFAGATLLSTDFEVRLTRHDADVAAGRTTKNRERRFFGPNKKQFNLWHTRLDALFEQHIQPFQRLDSSGNDIKALAEKVVEHMLLCWNVEA